jgi:hypothetical protein
MTFPSKSLHDLLFAEPLRRYRFFGLRFIFTFLKETCTLEQLPRDECDVAHDPVRP